MGTLIWITGLPGAGKTTAALELLKILQKTNIPHVHVDGDTVRDVLQNFDYSDKGRQEVGSAISRMATWLASQNLCVVCSTVSLRHEIHKMNRDSGVPYLEVIIQASKETLRKRDQKSLYSNAENDQEKHLPGVTQIAEFPKNPDLVIENDGSLTPVQMGEQIAKAYLSIKNNEAA